MTDSEWLFERLELGADDVVLDLAAGTAHMAGAVRAVVALDGTAAMLEKGRVEARRAEPRNVLFRRDDAAALPFLDASFDVGMSRFAAHHFQVPEVQVGEMRRCLRPGGRLAVTDRVADPDPEVAAVKNRLERLSDPSHTQMPALEELARLVGPEDVQFRDVERALGPWLAQAHASPEAAAEIRPAPRTEPEGGPKTGFRPGEAGGEPRFLHTMASVIA
jgi:ubiquinone/menaquinone biosynthesis C-methylase UbiE